MDVYNYDNDREDDTSFYDEFNQLEVEYMSYLEGKGHKKSYVENQLDLIKFFVTRYLIAHVDQSIFEVDGYDIYDFLGSWCVLKVYDHKKSSIIPYLRAFKKFFNFLFHKKKISKDQYIDLMEEFNNPRKYVEKFERFMDTDTESETRADDFEAWYYDENLKRKYDLKHELNLLLKSERENINRLPENLIDKISIVKDFKTFGNYISGLNHGIGLTQNLFCLKRNDILKLNSLMSEPENLKNNIIQKETTLIHFLFLASKRLGLFTYSKKMHLVPTLLYDNYYLKLSKKEQYWLLFRALWDKINWYRLNEYSLSGRPDWTYKSRSICALFFSRLNVDEWLSYKDLIDLFNDFHGEKNIFSPTCGFNLFWFFRIRLFSLFQHFG